MSEEPRQSPSAHAAAPALAEELSGALRCASCRYELRGLTIQGNCPECGLAIQATLLSLVDPRAAEIQPIASPRVVALGVNTWSMGAFAAVMLGWTVWVSGFTGGLLSDTAQYLLIMAGAVCLLASGVGAAAVIRPHRRIPACNSVAAVLGLLLYPLAIFLYVQVGAVASAGPGPSVLMWMSGRVEAMPWRWERLAMWLTLGVGAWMLRPNLRTLAARSLVMRAERVDRQTIAGSVAALGIAAAGDVLGLCAQLAGDWGGTIVLIGEVLVGVGAVLLTLGMIGIVVDTLRMTPAILQRPLAMTDVLAGPSG